MTKRTKQQYIILSAELGGLDDYENQRRTIILGNNLEDLDFQFKRAKGSYKGVKENSFFVNVNNSADIDTLKGFAFNNFDQDSILYSDSTGNCWLELDNGKCENVGTMKQVNPKFIEQLDSYTVVSGKVLTTEKI